MTTADTPHIAAVLLTRDRGALAIAAMRSLIEQDGDVEVFVSDNSTHPDDLLRETCRDIPSVQYMRLGGTG
ncbi:MAG: hypothetical protein M3Q69_21370, partial [Acidobacteriota bacterium]|nr:hypothetical protein [Acidobacteriota bacterium]